MFTYYVTNCRRRNIFFELTLEEFTELIQKPCYICGAAPAQIVPVASYRKQYAFRYNGLDRVDNTRGYSRKNVEPCCGQCNRAKGELTLAQFFEWIKRIHTRA